MPTYFAHTRLGFGCADNAGADARESKALLRHAFDQGIRHFDTARMYGDGTSESLLSELASQVRSEMFIVSKAGIAPPSFVDRAQRKASKLLLKRDRDAPARFGRFSRIQILTSVEASLRELGTDYLDALLLHECRLMWVSDELKRAIEDLRTSGKIRLCGIATSVRDSDDIARAHPDLCEIVQTPGRPGNFTKPTHYGRARLVIHSILGPRMAHFSALAAREPRVADGLKKQLGLDANDRGAMAAMLLQAALSDNPGVTVLFSSHNRAHIAGNAQISLSDEDIAAARVFEAILTEAEMVAPA